ncbi:MAG TPA: restriction endonuclease, partial [Acinetobacter lwoffii]|nr:restriction endonuclease [Acinetobacter lwoffii]
EIPEQQRVSLQQRMDWFTQLPDAEKQRMRETWQMMSSQERKELGARMQKASPEQRLAIREEYILKYQQVTQQPNSH